MSPEIFWDLGRWHGISHILTALLSTSDSLQKHSGDQKLYTKAGNTYGFNLGKLVYTNTINRSDKINIRINTKNGFLLSPSEPSTKLIDEITPIKKCKCCTTFVQNLNYTTLIQKFKITCVCVCVCVRVGVGVCVRQWTLTPDFNDLTTWNQLHQVRMTSQMFSISKPIFFTIKL